MGRILDVNQIVQQLLDGGHPSSTEVRGCQDHLNSRYQNKTDFPTASTTTTVSSMTSTTNCTAYNYNITKHTNAQPAGLLLLVHGITIH